MIIWDMVNQKSPQARKFMIIISHTSHHYNNQLFDHNAIITVEKFKFNGKSQGRGGIPTPKKLHFSINFCI